MSAANQSLKAGYVACALALLGGVFAISPARADVMEITGTGQSWVAGGPASQVQSWGAVLSDLEQAPQLGASVVTQTPTSAGPEHYRARVAELAAKYDISPALLEAVVWQESRWNPKAVSPVGARGLAQLMPATARMMGVNPDDPHHNLEGGARYLRMQLDAFDGDIEKALAAYNAGPGRVKRAGGIPKIRETQLYVRAIMARLSEPVRR